MGNNCTEAHATVLKRVLKRVVQKKTLYLLRDGGEGKQVIIITSPSKERGREATPGVKSTLSKEMTE